MKTNLMFQLLMQTKYKTDELGQEHGGPANDSTCICKPSLNSVAEDLRAARSEASAP